MFKKNAELAQSGEERESLFSCGDLTLFKMSGSPTAKSKAARGSMEVFVFPEELKFLEKDQSSHKQVLTLFNPYKFNMRFEGKRSAKEIVLNQLNLLFTSVFSTTPKLYAVVESKGFIKAGCCVDMSVTTVTSNYSNRRCLIKES